MLDPQGAMGPGAQPNPMMPPQGALASPSSTFQGSSHPLIDHLEAQHGQARAQFDKIDQAAKQTGLLRAGLDKLSSMGEAVTGDDVIEEMGKLVSSGLAPEGLIALMAGNPQSGSPPMPESGGALASWLADHEQQLKGLEDQVGQAHAQTAHQLGTTATKVLLAHHLADQARGRVALKGAQGAQGPESSPAPQGSPNPFVP